MCSLMARCLCWTPARASSTRRSYSLLSNALGTRTRASDTSFVHVARELTAHAGKEAYPARTLGVGEVVDVHPIVRHGPSCRRLPQQRAQRRRPPRARRAGHEDVEPPLLDAQPEFQRPQRPVLSDSPLQRRDLARRVEAKLRLGTAAPSASRWASSAAT